MNLEINQNPSLRKMRSAWLSSGDEGVVQEERDITITIDGEPIGILPATFQAIESTLTIRI